MKPHPTLLLVIVTVCAVRETHAADNRPITVKRISVVNEIAQPVMAKVHLVSADDKETYFAETDEKGVAEPNKPCVPGARVRVYPIVPRYLAPARYPPCAATMQIAVRRYEVGALMIQGADSAFAKANYGRATLLYTEAAYRLFEKDPGLAAKAEAKAYEAATLRLGSVKLYKYDADQERTVLTIGGVTAIKQFQRQMDIPTTGHLDARTAGALAGESIAPHIRFAYDLAEKK